MARFNKFKPKPPAAVAPPQEKDECAAAAPPPSAPSPSRDRTHAASTTDGAGARPSAAAASGIKHKAGGPKRKADGPLIPSPAPRRLAIPTLLTPPTKTPSTTAAVGAANWLALKAAASIGKKHGGKGGATTTTTSPPPPSALPSAIGSNTAPTRILAMDCEMVGVGPGGTRSALARVCLVNEVGGVVLDTHVSPRERVTDYRTHVSGVTPACLRGAPDLDVVRERVERLIAGRTLVGHAITHDLAALMISHPRSSIRDTARFPPFMRATAPGRRPKPRRLRDLAAEHLALAIQGGAHSPVDDARAALYLYQRVRREWEKAAARPGGVGKALSAPVTTGGKAAARAAAEEASAKLGALAEEDEMADL
jgi:RNA exonuclease 4